ncbi:MAG TPA: hypothetical protein VEQ15_00360 [Myxococcales bacterium]|nr:hypothetical protein [Myxococcales bacterium]
MLTERTTIVIAVAGAVVAVAAVLGVALVLGGAGALSSPLVASLAGFLGLLVPIVVALAQNANVASKVNGHLEAHMRAESLGKNVEPRSSTDVRGPLD